jgi:hypothetical protein
VEIVADRIAENDPVFGAPSPDRDLSVIEFAVATEYWIDVVGVSGKP